MKVSNQPDKELKVMVIKLLIMSLLKLIKHEHGENFKEEIDNIRMNKSGFKNRVTEMKNTLNAINSGLDQTKE